MAQINPLMTTSEEQFIVGESDFSCFEQYAYRLEGCAILFCRNGEAEVMIDQCQSRITRNTLILLLPGTYLLFMDRSEDFRASYCTFSRDLFSEAAFRLEPTFFESVHRNPISKPPQRRIDGADIWFQMAAYTYRIQNGMNLYNVGFACGLLAMICVPIMLSLGADPTMHYRWAHGYDWMFGRMLIVFCAALIVIGLFFCKVPVWAAWAGYRRLLQTSGRAPSDYLRMFGAAPVLINMGVNGLLGMAFILAQGGDLNGPTVGAILTIMGFSAFGKHAFNIIPVMAGVALGGFVMDWGLDDPAVQLACLFCTTLAPVSGYFGWPFGVLAGFLHSCVVLYTSSPVAGMNLYNNGFSGGLIAIFLYPTIIAIVRHRKPTLQDEDYFEHLEQDAPMMAPEPHEIVEERDDGREQ